MIGDAVGDPVRGSFVGLKPRSHSRRRARRAAGSRCFRTLCRTHHTFDRVPTESRNGDGHRGDACQHKAHRLSPTMAAASQASFLAMAEPRGNGCRAVRSRDSADHEKSIRPENCGRTPNEAPAEAGPSGPRFAGIDNCGTKVLFEVATGGFFQLIGRNTVLCRSADAFGYRCVELFERTQFRIDVGFRQRARNPMRFRPLALAPASADGSDHPARPLLSGRKATRIKPTLPRSPRLISVFPQALQA